MAIEDEIKSKSLTYAIVYYISSMGLDARNLSVSLIENYLKAKKGVTIRDLRMVGSIGPWKKVGSGYGGRESLSDLIFIIRFAVQCLFLVKFKCVYAYIIYI